MQLGVTKAPLDSPELKDISPSDTGIRVLSLLFDTKDDPAPGYHNFEEVLKSIKLTSLMSKESIAQIIDHYPSFINELALKYLHEDKLKQFPFAIKSANANLI
jgi:hypothetical protein